MNAKLHQELLLVLEDSHLKDIYRVAFDVTQLSVSYSGRVITIDTLWHNHFHDIRDNTPEFAAMVLGHNIGSLEKMNQRKDAKNKEALERQLFIEEQQRQAAERLNEKMDKFITYLDEHRDVLRDLYYKSGIKLT